MPTQGYIQVAPDNTTGKKVDNVSLTNDAGDTVYRQVTVLADPSNSSRYLGIGTEGTLPVSDPGLMAELVITNRLLSQMVMLLSTMSGISVSDLSPPSVL